MYYNFMMVYGDLYRCYWVRHGLYSTLVRMEAE